jgi:hypothetical protein
VVLEVRNTGATEASPLSSSGALVVAVFTVRLRDLPAARNVHPLGIAFVDVPMVISGTLLPSDSTAITSGSCCSVQARRSCSTSVS